MSLDSLSPAGIGWSVRFSVRCENCIALGLLDGDFISTDLLLLFSRFEPKKFELHGGRLGVPSIFDSSNWLLPISLPHLKIYYAPAHFSSWLKVNVRYLLFQMTFMFFQSENTLVHISLTVSSKNCSTSKIPQLKRIISTFSHFHTLYSLTVKITEVSHNDNGNADFKMI